MPAIPPWAGSDLHPRHFAGQQRIRPSARLSTLWLIACTLGTSSRASTAARMASTMSGCRAFLWCLPNWPSGGFQQLAEAMPNLLIVPLGELRRQLWSDGADVEVRSGGPTIKQQQPRTLQVLNFRDPCEQLLWLAAIFASSDSTNSCRPTGVSQDGDALILRPVLMAAPQKLLLWDLHPVLLPPIRHTCQGRNRLDSRCVSLCAQGVVNTYRLSRKAKSRSLPSNLSEVAVKAACCPRLNNMGMRGSPCSPTQSL